MSSTITASEESQLGQTIEMFEVITQSQPHDYQSLEILKEAYSKLGREKEAIATSKRIAEAYVQMGQLSSAILEYETILQRAPEDAAARAALSKIESKATNFPLQEPVVEARPAAAPKAAPAAQNGSKSTGRIYSGEVDDGRKPMQKIFVDTKIVTLADFEACWPKPDLTAKPKEVVEPFIQRLADKGVLTLDKALKVLCDHSRHAFIPLQCYEIDMELARSFPAEICQRWCLLPMDRMSKCILVATANPFNQQAAKELAEATPNRLLWYVVSPIELVKNVRKIYR